ncbi:MAG: ribonucleotide reductase N-terminal alpha domain-containing protein [Candidatus Thiodiazotropha sp.]
MSQTPFQTQIARFIWDSKYRYRLHGEPVDTTVADSWRRVATGVAGVESQHQDRWRRRFLKILTDFDFLPGGASWREPVWPMTPPFSTVL